MRYPVAALLFLVFSFIFFLCWVVMTFVVGTFHDTIEPLGTTIDGWYQAGFYDIMVTLPWAFGFLCALFFIMGIVVLFVLESWSDEPEFYYRQ